MLLFLWVFLSDMFFIQFFSYIFGKIVSDFVMIYCNYSHGYFLFDVIKGFTCCLTWIGRIDSCGFLLWLCINLFMVILLDGIKLSVNYLVWYRV